jgi:hypothetical protein
MKYRNILLVVAFFVSTSVFTSLAYAEYMSDLSAFNNHLLKNKRYTRVGIVIMNDTPADRDSIILLFGSHVAKMAKDAGSAGAELLKPSAWVKIYSKGPAQYFFQNNRDVILDVSMIALTLQNRGKVGFIVAQTRPRECVVYALVDNYRFTRFDASGPLFVRAQGTQKRLIGTFSFHSLPLNFRNNP